jgi:hypothetical protein
MNQFYFARLEAFLPQMLIVGCTQAVLGLEWEQEQLWVWSHRKGSIQQMRQSRGGFVGAELHQGYLLELRKMKKGHHDLPVEVPCYLAAEYC